MDKIFEVKTYITPQIYRRCLFAVVLRNRLNWLRIGLFLLYAAVFTAANIAFFKLRFELFLVGAYLPVVFFIGKHIYKNITMTKDFEQRLIKNYGASAVESILSFGSDGIYASTAGISRIISYDQLRSVSENRRYITISVKNSDVYLLFIDKANLQGEVYALKAFLQSKADEQMP